MGKRKGVKGMEVKGGKGKASYQREGRRHSGEWHWPVAHPGPLVAVLSSSTAGANGIKPHRKRLILKSGALGAACAPRPLDPAGHWYRAPTGSAFSRHFTGLLCALEI